MELYANEGTVGRWAEYDFKALKAEIKHRSGVKDTEALMGASTKIASAFEEAQAELLSLLTPIAAEHERDTFLADLVDKIKKEKTFSYNDFIKLFRPNGQQM